MSGMFDPIIESDIRDMIRNEAHAEERHEMLKDCTTNAIFLAADIMQARLRRENFTTLFGEFYKQCFILNIMCRWHNETEQEKQEDNTFFKENGHGLFKGKTQDRFKESFENIAKEEDDPKVIRFIEIIQTIPEKISAQMQTEAIDLFCDVIEVLGVY